MSFPRDAILVVLAFLSMAGLHAGDGPTPTDIAKAVRDLGDDSFVVREEASKFLWSAGRRAEAALQAALKSRDAEVVSRARAILEHFEFGIYPDTPRNIVDLVQRFRTGAPAGRQATVKELLALGPPGYAVVVKIVAAEKEPAVRRMYQQMVREATPRIVAALLTEDKLDAVEDLLEQDVRLRESGSDNTSIRHYAAILLLRGTLDKKIAELAARPESREPGAAEVLAYLHRANGDLASAFRSAGLSGEGNLQRWLLWEQGKWADLLERHPPRSEMRGAEEIQILGYQAAYQRLAGRTRDFEETVAQIRRHAESKKEDSSETWWCAEALFLNDRPQDAIDVLIQAKRYGSALEIFKDQMRYREAFALADKVKGEVHKEAFYLEIQRACMLYEVGEKEKALPLFARLADDIKDSTAEDWVFGHLVASEIRLGLKDLAYEHATLILARPKFSNRIHLFYQLLGDKSDGADMWWSLLRHKFPTENERVTLKRLRSIVEGTLERKELLALAEAAAALHPADKGVRVKSDKDKGDKEGEPREATKEERERRLGLLGEACLAAGLEKEAQRYFEDATEVDGGQRPLLRLADFLAERKQWKRAAALYGQAWEKNKLSPVALFLQGWALVQAGEKEPGEKRMKLAHWLPLANVEARYMLTEALAKRGLDKWVEREWQVSERVGDMDDWYTSNARRRLARAASANERFLEAAARREGTMLRCLNLNTGFLESSAYVTMPHWVHQIRARGLLTDGKIDEALQEIRTCLTFLPADVETPILLTPLLEKNGRKGEADELFAKVFSHCEQLVADHPRWAQQHNQVAWLAARCRRQLDKALTHAEKAVALDPKSASFLYTLAEVHFQRGAQAKAIELMRRCLELEPRSDFYRRQLKRFEAGDKLADVPPNRSS